MYEKIVVQNIAKVVAFFIPGERYVYLTAGIHGVVTINTL